MQGNRKSPQVQEEGLLLDPCTQIMILDTTLQSVSLITYSSDRLSVWLVDKWINRQRGTRDQEGGRLTYWLEP